MAAFTDFLKRPLGMVGTMPVTVGMALVALVLVYVAFFMRRR